MWREAARRGAQARSSVRRDTHREKETERVRGGEGREINEGSAATENPADASTTQSSVPPRDARQGLAARTCVVQVHRAVRAAHSQQEAGLRGEGECSSASRAARGQREPAQTKRHREQGGSRGAVESVCASFTHNAMSVSAHAHSHWAAEHFAARAPPAARVRAAGSTRGSVDAPPHHALRCGRAAPHTGCSTHGRHRGFRAGRPLRICRSAHKGASERAEPSRAE